MTTGVGPRRIPRTMAVRVASVQWPNGVRTMVNHLKKLQKADLLDPGEVATAVLFVAPSGNTMRMGTAAGVGGLVGAAAGVALDKRRENREAEEDAAAGVAESGLADQVALTGNGYLAVTDRRWVLLSHGTVSGKPKEVVAAFEHGDITTVEITKGKLVGKARVRFRDGSAVTLDAPRGQKFDDLTTAATAAGTAVTVE